MTDPIVSAPGPAAPATVSKTPAKSTDPTTADTAQAQGFASIVLMQLAQVLHLISPGSAPQTAAQGSGALQAGAANAGALGPDSGKALPLAALLQGVTGSAQGQAGDGKGNAKNAGVGQAAPGALTMTLIQSGAQNSQNVQGAQDTGTDTKLLQLIFPSAASGKEQALLQQLQHLGLLKGAAAAPVNQPGAHDSSNAIATLSQAPVTTRTVASAPAQAPVAVPVPVQHEGWSDALASRVAWQVGQNIQHAEIHLNPPNLGPLDVKISLQHDQASVQFSTHHALVRDALHDAIPRLREMLSQQGLNLADANVSQQSPNQGGQQQSQHQPGAEAVPFALGSDFIPAEEITAPGAAGSVTAIGLIDDYA